MSVKESDYFCGNGVLEIETYLYTCPYDQNTKVCNQDSYICVKEDGSLAEASKNPFFVTWLKKFFHFFFQNQFSLFSRKWGTEKVVSAKYGDYIFCFDHEFAQKAGLLRILEEENEVKINSPTYSHYTSKPNESSCRIFLEKLLSSPPPSLWTSFIYVEKKIVFFRIFRKKCRNFFSMNSGLKNLGKKCRFFFLQNPCFLFDHCFFKKQFKKVCWKRVKSCFVDGRKNFSPPKNFLRKVSLGRTQLFCLLPKSKEDMFCSWLNIKKTSLFFVFLFVFFRFTGGKLSEH